MSGFLEAEEVGVQLFVALSFRRAEHLGEDDPRPGQGLAPAPDEGLCLLHGGDLELEAGRGGGAEADGVHNDRTSSTLHPIDHPLHHLSGGAGRVQAGPGHGEMAAVGEPVNPDCRPPLVLSLVLLVLLRVLRLALVRLLLPLGLGLL